MKRTSKKTKPTPNPTPQPPGPAPGAKRLASPRLWELRDKLRALAERGVNGEKTTAMEKLQRLESRVDFTGPDTRGPDLFAGQFTPATVAAPIMEFAPIDFDIANAVKWAVEQATSIRCLYRGGQLMAAAAPQTANRLHDIAATVAASMSQLWRQFSMTTQANPLDRGNFVMGLYDGMMDEVRTGEALPQRAKPPKGKRNGRKKAAPAEAQAINLHPYSVATGLGKQIRCCVPFVEIAGELDKTIKGELEQATTT